MPTRHEELSRFSGSGKTFFFNKGEAENGTPYLAVNALYGRGQNQRLVLFPAHLFDFHRHLSAAIEKLTGFTAQTYVPEPVGTPDMPTTCTDCGSGCDDWRVLVISSSDWKLICRNCNEEIYTNA